MLRHPRNATRHVSRSTTLRATRIAVVVAMAGITVLHGSPPASAAVTCTQDWRPATTAAYLNADGSPTSPALALPPAPDADSTPRHLFCGGRYITTVWVARTETPYTVARLGYDVVRSARVPSVHPAVNPTLGVTGLASWFWATADDGPIRMLRGNGMDLQIELRVASVRWRFGDGTTTSVGGWGTAYPTPSSVQHVFERTGTYTVEAQVALVGHVEGEELDVEWPGATTVTLAHEVAQVRSLLHAE